MINKLDFSHWPDFDNHSDAYRLNWTPLIPVTIMYAQWCIPLTILYVTDLVFPPLIYDPSTKCPGNKSKEEKKWMHNLKF